MKTLSNFLIIVTVILFIISCNSDNIIHDENIFIKQDLVGIWSINYFWDQSDRTNEYTGYLFEFKNDGTIEVNVTSGAKISGTYKIKTNQIENEQQVIIDVTFFDAGDDMLELIEEWIVKKVSTNDNMIELEELESENPPEILHITRVILN